MEQSSRQKRLPLAATPELFIRLATLGQFFVDLHTLESAEVHGDVATYIGQASAVIDHVEHGDRTMWINAKRKAGFRGVDDAVRHFQIGGYQVCEKWLKDRKRPMLSGEDIAHYQKIVVALSETIRIQKEIDEVIEAHGGWPGAFAGTVPEGGEA